MTNSLYCCLMMLNVCFDFDGFLVDAAFFCFFNGKFFSFSVFKACLLELTFSKLVSVVSLLLIRVLAGLLGLALSQLNDFFLFFLFRLYSPTVLHAKNRLVLVLCLLLMLNCFYVNLLNL